MDVDGRAFVSHPIEVAGLLRQAGCSDAVVAAALLHDVVERTGIEVEQIRDRFGLDVAELVRAMTEDERIRGYEARKAAHRRQVAAAGRDAATIFVADKVAKARELRRAGEPDGARPTSTDTPAEAKLGHYRRTLEMFERTAPDLPLLRELRKELDALQQSRHAPSGDGT